MLVVAYKVNDQLVHNVEVDSGSCSQIILVGLTLVLTGANIFWIVWQYIQFQCGGNIAIMTVTCVGVVAMYGLVLARARRDASIFTSSIAALYCLYLQWSALGSGSDPECNPLSGRTSTVVWQIVTGLFFTVISLSVISGSTKSSKETSVASEVGGHMMEKGEELEDRPDVSSI